jgi:YesN/AraC family two-component response regulator
MYRLLIVDDEPKIIEGIKLMLNWKEYEVNQIITATSYNEAIQKAMEYKPHIGIFDVCIDDTRGYDIIETLNSFSLPTKYIMVSGYDEFEFARRALHAGAKDYLMKPIAQAELRRAVEKIIVEDFNGSIRTGIADAESVDPVLGIPYASLSNLTGKVILMVKGEYFKNINLKIIADKFKMNSNYLGQIFLKETNIKFSEYLMVYRLIQAREKIENTSEKIYNIAHQVGYSNINYFYTHFHSYFGVSPSDLRKIEEEKQ